MFLAGANNFVLSFSGGNNSIHFFPYKHNVC